MTTISANPALLRQKRASLSRRTRSRIYRRKLWRTRALAEMIKLAQWPVGKPAREVREQAVHKAVNRLRHWFPGERGRLVLTALNRRAVEEYRRASMAPSQLADS